MKLKLLYWKLESVIYELYARFLLFPELSSDKLHDLPNKLIVSLTSYPPRFSKLHLTIKSLLAQSLTPDRIILWIAHEDKKSVSAVLIEYEARFERFEIRYCEDLRSYKKIIPTLSKFPDHFIVTVDDDVFYSRHWLKGLCETWCGNPNEIVAYRAHKISFNIDGSIKPYSNWQKNYMSRSKNDCLFPTGCGGVLYPPGSLHEEVMNTELFRGMCPHADDVWLFWMGRLNQSRILVPQTSFNVVNWQGTDQSGLAQENVANNGNDLQIKALQKHYGTIQEISK